ncbi:hypothetical protein SDC9_190526 [bioreactor metagenome]|uniref:Uncharacterized protein n=1 Tax=bioreactor metagenome TaxID=1076179 RepID=A0A645HVF7_9ZZZZ
MTGSPRKRQCAFFELTEILHSEDTGHIFIGLEDSHTQRIIRMAPFWIRVDVDIAFVVQLRMCIHFLIIRAVPLEVQ